jgi:hypothetical protein
MSGHDEIHVLDQIEAYLAGGLPPDERVAFEAHAAACAACGAALAEARGREQRLNELFESVRPPAGFEHRMVQKLRLAHAPRRHLIHPMVGRAATGIAAAVLLAATGWVVSSELQHEGSPLSHLFLTEKRVKVASNLRQIGRAIATDGREEGNASPRHYWTGLGIDQDKKSPEAIAQVDGSKVLAATETNRGIQQKLLSDANGITATGREDAYSYYRVPSSGAAAATNWGLADRPTDLEGIEPKQSNLATTAGRIGGSGFAGGRDSSFATASRGLDGVDRPQQGSVAARQTIALAFKPTEQLGRQAGEQDDREQMSDRAAFGEQERQLAETPAVAQLDDKKATGQIEKPDGAKERASGKPTAPPSDSAPAPASTPANPATSPAPIGRKVIRNGTLEFEVDRFDDAVMRITKLVNEQDGFVATTDSDKLPNGHMKGTLTLRVPPERLDTLVLTLRGIGDLKSQKISAEDVTKHYTDLDSQLRAARAMEERLLGIIKSGNGQIKDLLAAEKELGVWREKIEAIEGEKRYLDNQVSLSTLVVSLYEKDIRTPASATEAEQVQMSLETDAVDDAYNKALEAIRGAKGRITQSELKQYDAGQFGATVVAAIPPDAAEQVIARLRQLNGRIAHFARDRHQTTKEGAPAPAAVMQVQREDTIVSLQIYNLANVAPRRTTSLQVATNSVDRAYAQVMELVRSAGGRIVTSSLTKPDPNTQVADLEAQVPAEKAGAVLDALRGQGEVMRQELSENPDTANVTEAKRGIRLRLVSLAAVPARETQTLQFAAANVPAAFNDILNAAKSADARVYQSDLSEQNPREITAAISIEVPRSAETSVNAAIAKAGQVLTRTINRSPDLEKTVDTKVRLTLSLISADHLPPRQTTTEQIQVADVGRASDDLVAAATSAGGRQIGTGGSEQSDTNRDTAHVVVEVPLNKLGPILDQLERSGARRSKQVSFDSTVPDSPLARARIDVTFSNSPISLGGEETTWDAIRNGLAVSGRGLRWSLQLLVIGFCFVAPWVLVLWVIWRAVRRSRLRPVTTPPPAP